MPRTGRPKKRLDPISPEQFVVSLAECGCPRVEIASRLNISVDTFDRTYAEVYRKGKEGGKGKLREKLYSTAMSGNVVAMIFLAKAMLGLKETSALELSNPDGTNLLSVDAKQRLHDLVARTAARVGPGDVPVQPDGN